MALLDRNGGDNQAMADIARLRIIRHKVYKRSVSVEDLLSFLSLVRTRMNVGAYPYEFMKELKLEFYNGESIIEELYVREN